MLNGNVYDVFGKWDDGLHPHSPWLSAILRYRL